MRAIVLLCGVRGKIAVDDLVLFPHVHGEDVLHLDLPHQLFDAKPLAPLAESRVERCHCRCDLGRDGVVRRLVFNRRGKLFDRRAVMGGHIIAIRLALALPVPPVEVAPVVDHLPLAAQKIRVADVR